MTSGIIYLPSLPRQVNTVDAACEIEMTLAGMIESAEDIEELQEWHARAEAVAAYLKNKDARMPMLGAMRRCEARIGQLLGPATLTHSRRKGARSIAIDVGRTDRVNFRILALAVDCGWLSYADAGDDSPWHASRRGLITGFDQWLRGIVEAEFLGEGKGSQKKAMGGGRIKGDTEAEFSVPVTAEECTELYSMLRYLQRHYNTAFLSTTLLHALRSEHGRVMQERGTKGL